MRALSRGLFACSLVLGFSLHAAPLEAQAEPSAEDVENARELFRTGLEAVEEERWEEARTLFERSYELVPRASTLLNLAAAQAETGRVVAAAASYRRFLEETEGDRRARRFRGDAEQALSEVEGRVAHVDLTVEGLRPDDRMELDGQHLDQGGIEGQVSMDPGQHVLVVRREGTEIGRVELVLVEGETRGVTIPLRELPEVNDALLEEPPPPSDDSALWIGIGVAAAVVVIGVGIALGVALAPAEEPYVGNLGPGMVTF